MNAIALQHAFKVLEHHKQHFFPCQVLILDIRLSKNKRPDKITIFLSSFYLIFYSAFLIMETLIKAFPSLDLRCEAANSFANPCDPPEVFKEMLI